MVIRRRLEIWSLSSVQLKARDGLSHDLLRDRFGLTTNDLVVLRLLSVPRRSKDLLELEDIDPVRTARLIRGLRLFGAILATDVKRAKAVVPIELRRVKKEVASQARSDVPTRRITLQDMPVSAIRSCSKTLRNLIDLDFFTLFDLDTETTTRLTNRF